MKIRNFTVPIFASLLGCQSLPVQNTVTHVDIKKYMGPWRVIASIPTMFEEGAFNAVEDYSWNEAKEQIDIDFHFNKGSFDGPIKKIPQRAWIHNHQTNAEWRVRPFWPLALSYLIVDLAPDYSDVMVGVPNRAHLWIMARAPKIPSARYSELVEKAKALGYDTNKIKFVPQK